MAIKTFEEFNNNSPVEEGLFSAFKIRKQIVKLQGLVVDEYERLMEDDPKRFRSGDDVMKAIKSFAVKTYDEVVTAEDAISFEGWWKDFSKAQAYMLDKLVFSQK